MLKTISNRLPNLLFGFWVWGISFFSPRQQGLWVFGAWEGKRYADNSKFLFEYIAGSCREIDCVWVTTDNEIFAELSARKVPVVLSNTREAAKILSRASVAFATHGMHDFGGGLSAKARLIYLSHGVPLKKIGYDVVSRKFVYSKWIRKFSEFLPMFRKPDYIICADEPSIAKFHSALRVPCERILPLGYSRWRPVYESASSTKLGAHRKFLYAPTLRGFGHAMLQFCQGEEVNRLAQVLRSLDAKMYVRPHPALQMTGWKEAVQTRPDAFVDFSPEIFNDVNEALGEFDVLIADYSSVIFDFEILQRPILSLVPDLEEYCEQSPGVYGKYEDNVPGPIFQNWAEIIEFIESNPDALFAEKLADEGKGMADLVDQKIVDFAKTIDK